MTNIIRKYEFALSVYIFTKTCVHVLDKLLYAADDARGSCQYRLYYDVLDSLHQSLSVVIVRPQVPEQCRQRPLVANVLRVGIFASKKIIFI